MFQSELSAWRYFGGSNRNPLKILPIAFLATGMLFVQGSLSAKAEDRPAQPFRPLVVLVHAADCKVCGQVRPIIEELEKEYKDKAVFIQLDVTDNKTKAEARKIAKANGIGFFLSFYEDSFPAFGVFNEKKKCTRELYGLNKKEDYKAAIDKALARK